jgi:hypothetical protein
MQGRVGTTALATCLGCSRQEPIWKVQGRNITFDPRTLTFRHRSRDCRDVRIRTRCSDRRSPKCRGSWLEYPSLFLRARQRRGTASTLIAGGEYFRRCGPCSSRRNAAKARSRLSGTPVLPLRTREHQIFAASRPRPRRAVNLVLLGTGRQSFTTCLLCGLAISRSSTTKTWSSGAFHLPCWRTWLRFSGQSPAPTRTAEGRFRSTKYTPRTWVHRAHPFVPPPALSSAGRRITPGTLSIGYSALLRVAASRAVLKEISDGRNVTPQNVAAARAQFLRYAPASWTFVFGGRASSNAVRQRLFPLPAAVQRGELDDPRRAMIVRRLLSFGMETTVISELVGWPHDRVAGEYERAVVASKHPRVVAQQTARRDARRPAIKEQRRTRYDTRRSIHQCTDCPRAALPGRSRCDEHLRASRKRTTRYRDRRKVPTCRGCGIPFRPEERQHGRMYHPDCIRQKERERKATPEYRARALRRVRSYQERHRQQGLCLKCPRAAVPGQVMCDRHRHPSALEVQGYS